MAEIVTENREQGIRGLIAAAILGGMCFYRADGWELFWVYILLVLMDFDIWDIPKLWELNRD